MADYIPGPDADFNDYQETSLAYINANRAVLGLVAADLTDLNAAQTAWDNAYKASNTAQAASKATTTAKDGAREVFEPLLRSLAQGLQISSTVTDAQRQAMKLPVRSTSRTRVSVPTTKPLATIDTSQRLTHLIDFRDADSPRSKARPDGIMGCEIWMKIGDTPPADPSELSFVTLDTNTPYLNQLAGAQAGKKAHYMLRWVNTRGEKGPWSDTASATVTG